MKAVLQRLGIWRPLDSQSAHLPLHRNKIEEYLKKHSWMRVIILWRAEKCSVRECLVGPFWWMTPRLGSKWQKDPALCRVGQSFQSWVVRSGQRAWCWFMITLHFLAFCCSDILEYLCCSGWHSHMRLFLHLHCSWTKFKGQRPRLFCSSL